MLRDLPARLGYVHAPRLASWFRKRWVLLRNPHADIRFEDPVYLGPGFSLHMPFGGSFRAGPGTEFRRNFRAEIGPQGRVTIGAGTRFTYDVVIQCSSAIDIGERVVVAQGVMIVDGSHRFRDLERPMLDQGYDLRPIRIDDDAAIMAKSTVIASVGRRSFVGANAAVTRDLPDYVVATGVPARPVDYFGPPGSEPPALASE